MTWNWHRTVAAIGAALIAGGVYVGGPIGYVMGAVGTIISTAVDGQAVISGEVPKTPPTKP